MSTSSEPTEPATSTTQRADRLKERIYVTFTSLAVVLALASRADELRPSSAALTLSITVVGTLLAVFVADLIAHILVHAQLPSRGELAHMIRVSSGSLGVLVLPLVFIGLAAIGRWELARALRAGAIALSVTLAVMGYLAARRVQLPTRYRIVVLFAEFALGIVVIALELLAHLAGEH